MMNHAVMIPVILAGGKGERFWPLSRQQRPKQFLSLDGSGRSLLQATADRLLNISGGWQNLWVVSRGDLIAPLREQLPDLPPENLLLEPEGRDTGPAVAWSTWEIVQRYGEEAVIGFFPADHWIDQPAVFKQTLTAASQLAKEKPAIVTLGVKPGYAATGYGYIEEGEPVGEFGGLPAYQVSRFTEKPDLPTAEAFLATGRFSWNSGMFIFRGGVVLAELRQYAPEIVNPIAAKGVAGYGEVPKKSIDYALMEKTKLAYVLPVDFGWDDLGDWNAIARLLQGDKPNLELAQHIGLDTTGCLFYATDQEDLIVTIGLENLVVVRDRHITLIVHKNRTQDIKQVLKKLQENPKFSQEC